MNSISVDLEKCDGCRSCVKACFVNVLRWDNSAKKPVVAYAEDCVHCNLCEVNCPRECIAVTPDFAAMQWSAL
jgi:NAD-dependent dihydropyrimidine dehydrogenase PreA subunit